MRMLRQATRSAFSKAYELYQRQRKPMIPFTSLQKGNYELKASPSSSSSSSSSSWFLTGPSLHHMQRKDIGYYTDSCHDYGNSALSIPHQSTRSITSYSMLLSSQQPQQEGTRKDLAAQDEDPFDSITDKIPERPVTFVEGASYSIAIFAGLAIALGAAYAVFKELIFEPKEYTTFGKALERVQNDHQVSVRLGSPIKGYGQESRNRAARQRISNRVWTDEDGVERIEVQFHIRGPRGAGIVHTEMFKDKVERKWKFTYLLVDITSPSPTRLMLESYVPK